MGGKFKEAVDVFYGTGSPPLEMAAARFIAHAFPRHYHETYLVQVVERGVDRFLCGDRCCRATPGTVAFIHPREVHTGQPDSAEPLEYRVFYPSSKLMRRLAAAVGLEGLPRFRSNIVDDPALAEELTRAHREAQISPGKASTRQVHRTLAWAIAFHAEGASGVVKEEPEAVRQIVELFERNPSYNYSLEELAEHTSFSPFYLSRLFTKWKGMPPHEYLLACRAERARELLRKGLPASEASSSLGFADQAHFTRSFRKIAGTTPGVFGRNRAIDGA